MPTRILDVEIKRVLNASTGACCNKIKSQSNEALNQRLYLFKKYMKWLSRKK